MVPYIVEIVLVIIGLTLFGLIMKSWNENR